MSIVITDGFMIKDASLYGLNDKISKISIYLKDYINKRYLKESVVLGCLILDYRALGKSDEFIKKELKFNYNVEIAKSMNYLRLLNYISKKDNSSIFSDDCCFDFKVEFILYPMEDKTLLRIATSNYDIKNIINNLNLKFDFLNVYDYWNNTDEPKDISKEEWDERRKDWNALIYKDDLFKLEIKEDYLISSYNFLKLTEKSKEIYNERINSIAKDILALNFDSKVDINEEDSISKINKAFNVYLKSNEYILDLNTEINKLKEILPEQYDFKEILSIRLEKSTPTSK